MQRERIQVRRKLFESPEPINRRNHSPDMIFGALKDFISSDHDLQKSDSPSPQLQFNTDSTSTTKGGGSPEPNNRKNHSPDMIFGALKDFISSDRDSQTNDSPSPQLQFIANSTSITKGSGSLGQKLPGDLTKSTSMKHNFGDTISSPKIESTCSDSQLNKTPETGISNRNTSESESSEISPSQSTPTEKKDRGKRITFIVLSICVCVSIGFQRP